MPDAPRLVMVYRRSVGCDDSQFTYCCGGLRRDLVDVGPGLIPFSGGSCEGI